MTLTFYRTNFDVTKNGVYEDIDKYLDGCANPFTTEYKHIDPALTVTVKLPLDSHQFTKRNIGDYCKAEDDDGTIYYYYVMNCQWKGKETLLVTLGLDTLNTFWNEINSSLTAETHITRRFKDRFWFGATSQVAYPKIDRKEESFGTVPMYQVSRINVNPTGSTRKWNLVYRTVYDQTSENLAQNPVTCYAIPSSKVNVTATSGSVEWNTGIFSTYRVFYLGAEQLDDGESFKCTFYADGSKQTISFDRGALTSTGEDIDGAVGIVWSTEYNRWYIKRFHGSGVAKNVVQIFETTSNITFERCRRLYEQDVSTDTMMVTDKLDQFYQHMTLSNPYTLDASDSAQSLTAFSEWYASNKTDSRLVKIRELPYAPFKEEYNSDGTLKIPSGWTVQGNLLKFTGTTFGSYQLCTTVGHKVPTLDIKKSVVDGAPNMDYETKLLNSSFYVDKLVYDTSTWAAQWEKYAGLGKLTSDRAKLQVYYAVSDGLDNGMLFRIATDFELDTDFGDYMVIDKSTDKPYYTNEYLNYLRYGKAVDEKAAGLNIASSVVSGVGSIASTVSSFAFTGATVGSTAGGPFGAAAGAGVGALVGIVTSAMSIGKTVATAYDTINSKIDAYTHQASAVSGTSDVSLFNLYGANKLLNFVYEPIPEIKQMLFDYFRLYGYADDVYAIPKCTRRYVDYFQCEPVFSKGVIWDEFKDDIRQRMQLGYRVFHLHGVSYDLTFEKENWETSIWEWANGAE